MPTYRVGDGQPYATITAAIAAIPNNLAGGGVQIVEVYQKATGYAERIDLVAPGFIGPGPGDYIDIRAMVPHNGLKDHGITVNLQPAGSTDGDGVELIIYSRLTGFCFTTTDPTPGTSQRIILCQGPACRVAKCMIYDCQSPGSTYGVTAINMTQQCYVWNCEVFNIATVTGNSGVGIYNPVHGFSGNPTQIKNCTAYNVKTRGIWSLGVNYSLVDNCYSGGPGVQNFNCGGGVGSTFDFCISQDATATGTNCLINRPAANQFVSIAPGVEDLHIVVTADCNRVGLNNAAWFSDDIDDQLRTNYNTGADELGGGPPAPYSYDDGSMMQIIG